MDTHEESSTPQLPDYVNVRLRNGDIVRGMVTGKRLDFPRVRWGENWESCAEVATSTLLRIAETNGALRV